MIPKCEFLIIITYTKTEDEQSVMAKRESGNINVFKDNLPSKYAHMCGTCVNKKDKNWL
jgi:hypothetical protein